MSKITQNTIIETFSSYRDLCNLYLIIDAAQQPEKITDFIRQKYGKTNLIFHSLFAGTQEGNVPFRASPIYIKMDTDNMYENSPICLLFEELCQTESMINIIGSTQDEAIFVKHLKNYLSICDEDGTPYLFRWYDPRIGKYMHQILTEEQWLEFTAPIEVWWISMVRYGFENQIIMYNNYRKQYENHQ